MNSKLKNKKKTIVVYIVHLKYHINPLTYYNSLLLTSKDRHGTVDKYWLISKVDHGL
jgi:hypothetical protein